VRVEQNDKLATAHDELVRAVEALVSGEDWAAMLEMAARFHRYSSANVLLILSQCPGASRCAGYRTWQGLGRQVRRGEKGIGILAPVIRRRRGEPEAETERILAGFRVVFVFDYAQTEGEPLPDVAPVALTGEAPERLWEALGAQVEAAGFELTRGDCGPANGVTDYMARRVTVSDCLEPAQAAKTVCHELAHALLHDGTEYAAGCRGLVEVEAESVAFLVCRAAGLDASAYTFPYVASWAQGETKVVLAAAERAIRTARAILAAAGLEDASEADGLAGSAA